jgi:hypothetical protein
MAKSRIYHRDKAAFWLDHDEAEAVRDAVDERREGIVMSDEYATGQSNELIKQVALMGDLLPLLDEFVKTEAKPKSFRDS